MAQQRKKKKIDKRLRAFLEDEAELGSDNEENDERRRDINSNDEGEFDDDSDKDLDGFVVHQPDEEEIGEENDEMLRIHDDFMREQDKQL